MRKSIFVILFFAIATCSASAQTFTAQRLHDEWLAYERYVQHTATSSDLFMASHFMGYVVAVVDSISFLQTAKLLKFSVDLNQTMQLAQFLQMVGNYLDAHPESWSDDATSQIMIVVISNFPVTMESRAERTPPN